MNIDPKIWGPSSWKFMHYITIGYPEKPTDEIKKSVYNFFISLKNILPCEKCRYNFGHHLLKHPLTDDILSSRTKLINWLIDIHNDVNISTNKPTISYQQMLEIYMNPQVEPFSQIFNSFSNIDTRILTILVSLFLLILIMLLAKSRLLT